jgi:hypothetical protein
MRSLSISRIRFLLFLIVLIAGSMHEKNSMGQPRETLVKAGYIEKFTHFVLWPKQNTDEEGKDEFIIAIIGENTIGNALSDVLSKSNSKDKEFKIVYISSVEEINGCMILFISSTEKNNIDKILKFTAGKPILTISDSKGFGEKGVILNMFLDESYIRYEINRSSLDKSGLIINSLLLNYAVII